MSETSSTLTPVSKLPTSLKAFTAKHKWGITAVAILIAAIGIKGCGSASAAPETAGNQLDREYTVQRGSFDITVLARGELDAIKNHELRFTGKGKEGLRVAKHIEDRAEVYAGDVVIKFADEQYIELITSLEEEIFDLKVDYDKAVEQRIESYDDSVRDFKEAMEDAELNRSLFLSELAVARDKAISELTEASNKFDTTKEALNKYENLDYRSLGKGKQADIDLKEQEYYEKLDEMKRANQQLSDSRLKDENAQEKAERAVALAEKQVNNAFEASETARKADRSFRRYEHPQTLRKLTIEAEKSELDLKRLIVKAESDRVQNERRYRKLLRDKQRILEQLEELSQKHEEELERLKDDFETHNERLNERLTELKEDLAGLTLRAPVDGIVTLGKPAQRGRDPEDIEVGTDVSPNEVVARIPDLSQFLVRSDVPEIYRSRLKTGQAVLLRNAALPELRMKGELTKIDSMSERMVRWDPRSPRTYKTEISTNNSDPRLMPGMTVEVEIQVDTVEDVLFVPVEAVYNKDGDSYCKLVTSFGTEEVQVKTGQASDSYVEISDGLKEGQKVLLHTTDAG